VITKLDFYFIATVRSTFYANYGYSPSLSMDDGGAVTEMHKRKSRTLLATVLQYDPESTFVVQGSHLPEDLRQSRMMSKRFPLSRWSEIGERLRGIVAELPDPPTV